MPRNFQFQEYRGRRFRDSGSNGSEKCVEKSSLFKPRISFKKPEGKKDTESKEWDLGYEAGKDISNKSINRKLDRIIARQDRQDEITQRY